MVEVSGLPGPELILSHQASRRQDKPPRSKWAVAGEQAHISCQGARWLCEIWVCRIRIRRAQSLRLPTLGLWPGKWDTRCPHISTPVISHAEGARTHKTLHLAHYTPKPGRRSASSCSVSPLSSLAKFSSVFTIKENMLTVQSIFIDHLWSDLELSK